MTNVAYATIKNKSVWDMHYIVMTSGFCRYRYKKQVLFSYKTLCKNDYSTEIYQEVDVSR